MKEVIWEHLKDFLVIELKLLYSIPVLIPLSAGFVSGIEEGRDGGIGATSAPYGTRRTRPPNFRAGWDGPPTFENFEVNKSPKCTPFGIKCSKLRRRLGLRPRPGWRSLRRSPVSL